ncbi:MAG: tRNA 2-thiouridine(34) synthase MnmA, partial [Candidatus Pacebacteria bacterium]|nr:tRNA 2-thiouridine(34) synthase MnmA [Candidatus Paceibacterota bacterium]
NKSKKVIVGMSGGVDSSVAAALLQEQGYEVIGVFMYFWHDVSDKLQAIDTHIENRCCSREAEEGARKVAQKLGIKFYSINVDKEFKKAVVDYFLFEYKQGRTPNPCIECNRSIKFGVMIDKAMAIGADFVATGHYVKKLKTKNLKLKINYKLLKAKDENKDQSYFLYTLNQKKLKHCLFPIGDYEKKDIRILAKKYSFEIAERKESQEICFIQSKRYGDFLKKYIKLIPGEIIDVSGDVLGKHKGLPLYTIGQRRDIGIGGTGPYYVIGMNRKKNQLIVSNNKNYKNLFSNELVVKKVNWISGNISKFPLKIKAKVRYSMDEELVVVNKIKEKYAVKFSKAQRAVMPGQSIVFYKGSEILGGGIIT